MARQKRGSRDLIQAERRLAGIESIDPQLILGEGLSAQTYANKIDALRQDLAVYNSLLSTLDALQSKLKDAEVELADYSEKILLGVAHNYGKNSYEYKQADGVRKRDSASADWSVRKRPARTVGEPITP